MDTAHQAALVVWALYFAMKVADLLVPEGRR